MCLRDLQSLFTAQRASNAKNVSIWWRHHVYASSASTIGTYLHYKFLTEVLLQLMPFIVSFWHHLGIAYFVICSTYDAALSMGTATTVWYWELWEKRKDYVNPGCGRSRRSPDLEVSIAPGRRAQILIAVTAGGYCLTLVWSRSGHTICRGAAKPTQPHSLQRIHPHLINSIFASKLHAQDPLHSFADTEHIFRQLS